GPWMTPSPSPCHNRVGLQNPGSIAQLNARIVTCRRCPRLVKHREAVAAAPPRRYLGQRYWARPLRGLGDPRARLLLGGRARAAQGGTRRGRMFRGDQGGDWFSGARPPAGFANRPPPEHREDGLRLDAAYTPAAVRCAPPLKKPTLEEMRGCEPYLLTE